MLGREPDVWNAYAVHDHSHVPSTEHLAIRLSVGHSRPLDRTTAHCAGRWIVDGGRSVGTGGRVGLPKLFAIMVRGSGAFFFDSLNCYILKMPSHLRVSIVA